MFKKNVLYVINLFPTGSIPIKTHTFVLYINFLGQKRYKIYGSTKTRNSYYELIKLECDIWKTNLYNNIDDWISRNKNTKPSDNEFDAKIIIEKLDTTI